MNKVMFFLLISIVMVLSACGKVSGNDAAEEKLEFTAGFGYGPYQEHFEKGIVPILEKKGYKVNVKTFQQYPQVHFAMKERAIDLEIQSTANMHGINDELGIEMVSIFFAPSAPMGLFSKKHTSLDEIKDGTTIALPSDGVGQERAARVLEDLGIVTIDDGAGIVDFNLNSVHPVEHEIKLVPLDPALILTSLPDVDYGFVYGNYIVMTEGIELTDAIYLEHTPEEHRMAATILKENENTQWAKDLKEAYLSEEFKTFIKSNPLYDGLIAPVEWGE